MTLSPRPTSSLASSANIAHGVCPPLTANVKVPRAVTAARADAAANADAAAATRRGDSSTWSSVCIGGPLFLLGVAAEFAAHRRQDLVGEVAEPARFKAPGERGRDERS